MVLARTSKLQAVNKALQMMGESPLNSLQGLLGLGNLAEETLDSVSRKVQVAVSYTHLTLPTKA